MIDLSSIHEFTTGRPDSWTLYGAADDFDKLPQPHKDQILFLDKAANNFIHELLAAAKLVTGEPWNPFSKGNFTTVEHYSDFSEATESKQHLKKWLYQRGLPVSSEVFILPSFNEYPMLTTWKIVVKYAYDLFHADDVVVFDKTFNWCLFY